jgi:hypothetical protein
MSHRAPLPLCPVTVIGICDPYGSAAASPREGSELAAVINARQLASGPLTAYDASGTVARRPAEMTRTRIRIARRLATTGAIARKMIESAKASTLM